MATLGTDAFVGDSQIKDLTNFNFAGASPGGWIDVTNATFTIPLPGTYLFVGSVREVIVLASGSTGKQLIRLFDVDADAVVAGSQIGNASAVATLAPAVDATVGYSFTASFSQPTTIQVQLGLSDDPSTYTSAVTGAAAGGHSWMTMVLLSIKLNDA